MCSTCDQYKAALEGRREESTRYWTVFAIMSVINGAMLTFLNKDQRLMPTVYISFLGFVLCLSWLSLQLRLGGWVEWWEAKLKRLESHIAEEAKLFTDRKLDTENPVYVGFHTRIVAGVLASLFALTWVLVGINTVHGNITDFSLSNYLKLDWPLDLVSTLAGGIVGFLLVFIIHFIKKPRMKVLGFEQVSVNFGTLYKLRFKIKGLSSPGICRLRVSWSDKSVYAKWDESPNPLEDDDLSKFKPELVPGTFDQPLFRGIKYSVPIVIENNANREVFSGWWFGKKIGYGPNPRLEKGFNLKLTLYGAGLSWTRSFTEKEICKS